LGFTGFHDFRDFRLDFRDFKDFSLDFRDFRGSKDLKYFLSLGPYFKEFWSGDKDFSHVKSGIMDFGPHFRDFMSDLWGFRPYSGISRQISKILGILRRISRFVSQISELSGFQDGFHGF